MATAKKQTGDFQTVVHNELKKTWHSKMFLDKLHKDEINPLSEVCSYSVLWGLSGLVNTWAQLPHSRFLVFLNEKHPGLSPAQLTRQSQTGLVVLLLIINGCLQALQTHKYKDSWK